MALWAVGRGKKESFRDGAGALSPRPYLRKPLDAYLRALEALDERTRKKHLEEHAKALKAHIRELRGKEYWRSLGLELVVMYIPGEPILSAAFEGDPDRNLMDFAFQNDVGLFRAAGASSAPQKEGVTGSPRRCSPSRAHRGNAADGVGFAFGRKHRNECHGKRICEPVSAHFKQRYSFRSDARPALLVGALGVCYNEGAQGHGKSEAFRSGRLASGNRAPFGALFLFHPAGFSSPPRRLKGHRSGKGNPARTSKILSCEDL
ncbi:DNA recombination protein RmuC [Thermoflexus sp.]|uniref:DNA recombination protein RmuC n=1 Tax=Thermoflexus sp. TaxID=1969742 RepID=UPI003A100D2C